MKLYHITVPGSATDPEAAEKEATRVFKAAKDAGLDATLSRGFGTNDSVIVIRSETELTVGVGDYAAVLFEDAEGGKDDGATQRKPGSRKQGGNTDVAADAPNE
jgi:hypothetical protein